MSTLKNPLQYLFRGKKERSLFRNEYFLFFKPNEIKVDLYGKNFKKYSNGKPIRSLLKTRFNFKWKDYYTNGYFIIKGVKRQGVKALNLDINTSWFHHKEAVLKNYQKHFTTIFIKDYEYKPAYVYGYRFKEKDAPLEVLITSEDDTIVGSFNLDYFSILAKIYKKCNLEICKIQNNKYYLRLKEGNEVKALLTGFKIDNSNLEVKC